jgi:hypothetical protein
VDRDTRIKALCPTCNLTADMPLLSCQYGRDVGLIDLILDNMDFLCMELLRHPKNATFVG